MCSFLVFSWRLLVTVLIGLSVQGGNAYKTYDLESSCLNGSVTFYLGDAESSAAILQATSRISYSLAMKCQASLVAKNKVQKVLVSLREVDLRPNLDGSCKDYLQIDKPMCERMLRYDEERHYVSKDNVLRVSYYTSPDGLDNKTLSGHKGFTLIFTALFKDKEDILNGTDGLFRCLNDNYIWSGLTCDGHNNCGDLSDEDNSNCGGRGPTVLIILGVLIAGALLLMCAATFFCSKNERVRRFSTRVRSFSILRQRPQLPPSVPLNAH